MAAPDTLDGFLHAARVPFARLSTANTPCICPSCSHLRKKKFDKCCRVRLNDRRELVLWDCSHCGENGFFHVNGLDPHPVVPLHRVALRAHEYTATLRKVIWPPRPGKPKKSASWEIRGRTGEWHPSAGGLTLPPLYHLEAVKRAIAAGHLIAVVEGEKDVDTLAALGIPATCSPHGAAESEKKPKWTHKNSEPLRGANLVVFNDNDDAGYAHAAATVASTLPLASSVRRVDLKDAWPEIPVHKDVSDWLDFGGGTPEKLRELMAQAPLIDKPPGDLPHTDGQDADTSWLALCLRSDTNKPIDNVYNACIAIEHDARWKDMFAFDEMLRAAVRRGARPVTDNDVVIVQKSLQRAGLRRMPRITVADAIENVARNNAFHPVRNWLETLQWDRIARLNKWTSYFLGADDNAYNSQVGIMFLISMVARIFKPGCQCDYMIVLEGEQGELKSSLLRALAEPWFDDNLPDVTNKDSSQYLRGKWLVEIKEMHAFSKAENTDIKKFIDRREERYFARYGRLETFEPRQTVFAGTTNKDTYLRDETGGRRFWPIKCGQIDIDNLKRERNQLFAEAVVEYRAGTKWWPDREFERQHIKPQQDARFDEDAWLKTIATYVAIMPSATVMDIAENALGIPKARLGKPEQMRISQILQVLKWKKKHTELGNVWFPPT
ncbi:MAG TPA: VapE domain-containing protein [Xanthobacteraceae bacterium]|nr:VapE domain-containing protein [Xanthobacteraceae bacterium]